MGYIKVIQYADIVEIYEYEKTVHPPRRKRPRRKIKAPYKRFRSSRSVVRSRNGFYRLCAHNNHLNEHISFLTLTFAEDQTYKQANRYASHFYTRIRNHFKELSLSYISVPEYTEKGRIHLHMLLYGLPPEEVKKERTTRNLQRQFRQGYLDIRYASYRSKGIAGYMAKYMGKALGSAGDEITRGYTCSRNCHKISAHGSNALDGYMDMIDPKVDLLEEKEYSVKYMGKCRKRVIKHNNKQ